MFADLKPSTATVHRTVAIYIIRVPRCMQKEEMAKAISSFWYTGRDSNPQPSEPESDALSIEPPVHSSVIIARFFRFVKRAFSK